MIFIIVLILLKNEAINNIQHLCLDCYSSNLKKKSMNCCLIHFSPTCVKRYLDLLQGLVAASNVQDKVQGFRPFRQVIVLKRSGTQGITIYHPNQEETFWQTVIYWHWCFWPHAPHCVILTLLMKPVGALGNCSWLNLPKNTTDSPELLR